MKDLLFIPNIIFHCKSISKSTNYEALAVQLKHLWCDSPQSTDEGFTLTSDMCRLNLSWIKI